eukprot:CAMPEP_0184133196 /NCGR_PEP_ID=MMETSP0974-20121125/29011_1 /TAXON_ID=483370 /ORGANISM="non described non described, Strain CCMP2097" /LENGTH=141 /DNA_ID=CAMNT_0026436723 /DNA_START=325 /DNA_END=747 /DNA_ORIENTATION=+
MASGAARAATMLERIGANAEAAHAMAATEATIRLNMIAWDEAGKKRVRHLRNRSEMFKVDPRGASKPRVPAARPRCARGAFRPGGRADSEVISSRAASAAAPSMPRRLKRGLSFWASRGARKSGPTLGRPGRPSTPRAHAR